MKQATAFAPAGVGNVAVGFDLLGHVLDVPGLGDTVQVRCVATPGVRITAISGLPISVPLLAEQNTAGRALLSLCAALELKHGLEVSIQKGIPLGSGLGGSAASAVAAVLAANEVLGAPFTLEQLYPFALDGECAASGARHGDNVGAQLLGGLVLSNSRRCFALPVPAGLVALVVHPDFVLETRTARAALSAPYPLGDFVAQNERLAGFLCALYRDDLVLLRESLSDVLVEPRRAPLIPRFAEVKAAALSHDALGASISGAGPSVFAWFASRAPALAAAAAMVGEFAAGGLSAQAYLAPIAGQGARLLD